MTMQKFDPKSWQENPNKRSLWSTAYLFGMTDIVLLPQMHEDALLKSLINGHAQYLLNNSTSLLNAFIDSNLQDDVFLLHHIPHDWNHTPSDDCLHKRIKNYLSHTLALTLTSDAPIAINNAITLLQSTLPQLTGSPPQCPGPLSANHTKEKIASKAASGKKPRFAMMSGLQVEFPLHLMDASKPTMSHILDIQDSWTTEHALCTITSDMGVDFNIHKIAYKTLAMKIPLWSALKPSAISNCVLKGKNTSKFSICFSVGSHQNQI
ncbi:uncharacterized protein EI90DRAFT_3010902 [Cantharellus anzutake]|uniref:uncharacterized protein n=1 Tax=Cantharellus anzutake TaxID=1750568 RepID=UPI00190819FA|nr:uncharacterized protein EI90DRAFT_3010902 [Cantharellus anzutake]KAF8344091.1 hypothetical protein EI90DRAFT_3010902 [Cantharellus anzutake]